jgi:DNA polymerase
MTSRSDRREILIREMGVGPLWKKREPGAAQTAQNHEKTDVFFNAELSAENASLASVPAIESSFFVEELPSSEAGTLQGKAPSANEISLMNWEQLKENVAGCVKCRLCQTRTKTVFGVGDEKARWLFVGEGPGRNEDAKGEPFVGPAGKLLDNMLLSMGLRRGENAYIANTVKCRPIAEDGRDRPPAPDEAEACLPYLERQIALIKPTIIVALGKSAALSLLKLPSDTPVTKLRGKVHQYHDLPLVVTYHPAYLLRKLTEKGKVWSDLCFAMNTYASAS